MASRREQLLERLKCNLAIASKAATLNSIGATSSSASNFNQSTNLAITSRVDVQQSARSYSDFAAQNVNEFTGNISTDANARNASENTSFSQSFRGNFVQRDTDEPPASSRYGQTDKAAPRADNSKFTDSFMKSVLSLINEDTFQPGSSQERNAPQSLSNKTPSYVERRPTPSSSVLTQDVAAQEHNNSRTNELLCKVLEAIPGVETSDLMTMMQQRMTKDSIATQRAGEAARFKFIGTNRARSEKEQTTDFSSVGSVSQEHKKESLMEKLGFIEQHVLEQRRIQVAASRERKQEGRTYLSVTEHEQLLNSMEEIHGNITKLEAALSNLIHMKQGMMKLPVGMQRESLILDNMRMQEEINDQLWALNKVSKDISSELLENDAAVSAAARHDHPVTSERQKFMLPDEFERQRERLLDGRSQSQLLQNYTRVLDDSELQAKLKFINQQAQSASATLSQSPLTHTTTRPINDRSVSRSRSRSPSAHSRHEDGSQQFSSPQGNRNIYIDKRTDGSWQKESERSPGRSMSRLVRNLERKPDDEAREGQYGVRQGVTRRSVGNDRRRSRSRDSRSPHRRRNRDSQSPRSRRNRDSRSPRHRRNRDSRSPRHRRSRNSRSPRRRRSRDSRSPRRRRSRSDDCKIVAEDKLNFNLRRVKREPERKRTKSEEKRDEEKAAMNVAISTYMSAEEYYDAGNLWCKKCDVMLTDIGHLCQHLHSDCHQRKIDENFDKPRPLPAASVNKKSNLAPARGDEFLLPLAAFFCSICCEFMKDKDQAENHMVSSQHNNKFKQFLKENAGYELQFLTDKMAVIQNAKKKETDEVPESTDKKYKFKLTGSVNTLSSKADSGIMGTDTEKDADDDDKDASLTGGNKFKPGTSVINTTPAVKHEGIPAKVVTGKLSSGNKLVLFGRKPGYLPKPSKPDPPASPASSILGWQLAAVVAQQKVINSKLSNGSEPSIPGPGVNKSKASLVNRVSQTVSFTINPVVTTTKSGGEVDMFHPVTTTSKSPLVQRLVGIAAGAAGSTSVKSDVNKKDDKKESFDIKDFVVFDEC